jgi:S-adenosylhomocysteine hydrolase
MKANNYNVDIEITTTYNEETLEEKNILRIKDYSLYLSNDSNATIFTKEVPYNFLTEHDSFYKEHDNTITKYEVIKIKAVLTTCDRYINAVVTSYTCRINVDSI